MGSRSKMKVDKKYTSTKSLKQWCKARGIDFKEHCAKFGITLTK